MDYVGGFEAGRFAYFATRQLDNLSTRGGIVQSRLLRVCTGDKNFYSYAEVSHSDPICLGWSQSFDLCDF